MVSDGRPVYLEKLKGNYGKLYQKDQSKVTGSVITVDSEKFPSVAHHSLTKRKL